MLRTLVFLLCAARCLGGFCRDAVGPPTALYFQEDINFDQFFRDPKLKSMFHTLQNGKRNVLVQKFRTDEKPGNLGDNGKYFETFCPLSELFKVRKEVKMLKSQALDDVKINGAFFAGSGDHVFLLKHSYRDGDEAKTMLKLGHFADVPTASGVTVTVYYPRENFRTLERCDIKTRNPQNQPDYTLRKRAWGGNGIKQSRVSGPPIPRRDPPSTQQEERVPGTPKSPGKKDDKRSMKLSLLIVIIVSAILFLIVTTAIMVLYQKRLSYIHKQKMTLRLRQVSTSKSQGNARVHRGTKRPSHGHVRGAHKGPKKSEKSDAEFRASGGPPSKKPRRSKSKLSEGRSPSTSSLGYSFDTVPTIRSVSYRDNSDIDRGILSAASAPTLATSSAVSPEVKRKTARVHRSRSGNPKRRNEKRRK